MWIIVTALLVGGCRTSLASQAEACNQNDIQQCEVGASALFKDSSLVYPDSAATLDRACGTWNEFTKCIYKYTSRCLTVDEKSRFNQSFKEPVTAMNTLCQDKNYRKEYLTYAPCIKKIATEESNCGLQYRFLIDLFSGNTATMKQLCCAREKFRKCILLKTRDKCSVEKDAGYDSGQAKLTELNVTVFATQVLDKSLAFIAQQCSVSSVKEEDCPGIQAASTGQGQTFIRPNSKGPLQNSDKDSELQSAASNERTRETNSTDFKLGKRPSSTSTSASNFQLGSNSVKFPSSNSNSIGPNAAATQPKPEPQDNPKPGHLSGANNGDDQNHDGGGDGGGNILQPGILLLVYSLSTRIIVSLNFT